MKDGMLCLGGDLVRTLGLGVVIWACIACDGKDGPKCDTGCDTGDPPGTFHGWDEKRLSLAGADHTLLGENAGDKAGFHVAGVGDVDADGLDDVLVTADTQGDAGEDGGKAYLVTGAALVLGEQELGDLKTAWVSEGEADLLGHAGLGAGDVDGDGLGDVLVSAYIDAAGGVDRGTVYLLLGSEIAAGASLGAVAHTFVGEADLDRLGHGLGGQGDVDGDGVMDLFMGAYGNSEVAYSAGKAYLVLGSGLSEGALSVADADHALTGVVLGDKAGFNVALVGDVDGDGRDDLHVGAKWNDESGNKSGQSYLVYAETLLAGEGSLSLASADHRFLGVTPWDQCCVGAAAGDVDGDGRSDLVLGAQYDELDDSGSGRVYLFLASSLGELGARSLDGADYLFEGEALGDSLGISVASAGDLDKDGLSDLFFGGFRRDTVGDELGGGVAYLFYGADLTGREGTVGAGEASHVFLGTEEFGGAGRSVAGAGDVNGDGLLDLVVGAPMEQDLAEEGTGRAHVILTP